MATVRTSHTKLDKARTRVQMTGPRFSEQQFTCAHYLAAWSRPVWRTSVALIMCAQMRVCLSYARRASIPITYGGGSERSFCVLFVSVCVVWWCGECARGDWWRIAFCVVSEQTSLALINVTREPRSCALSLRRPTRRTPHTQHIVSR